MSHLPTRWAPSKEESPRGTQNVKRAVVGVVLGCLATLMSFTTSVRADNPPDPQQVQFAQRTSDLMLATLFAALLQEFAETTPANVKEGKKSISLMYRVRCVAVSGSATACRSEASLLAERGGLPARSGCSTG